MKHYEDFINLFEEKMKILKVGRGVTYILIYFKSWSLKV